MYYLISDTVSFVLIDITPSEGTIDSYILCAGTNGTQEDVHQLWVKWWNYSQKTCNGLDYLNNKNLKRKYFKEWVSITKINLDNIDLNIDIFDVNSLNDLQKTLFVKVIEKMNYSGYKMVPVEVIMEA
ncbi:hypothetical protein [Methanosphaera sp.]|jgi:hypothetical protein|uniref:hypothetical protein n=1 Tax=Methanosphaera sp. TaxID=2666342 RepID=UPI003D92CB33